MTTLSTKPFKEFYYHTKFRETIINRRCLTKKLLLKNSQYSPKTFVSLFNKNASLRLCNFIKKVIEHNCFPLNIPKFLRTSILKSICERLFERFPTWTNNISYKGRERKKKRNKKPFQNSDEKKPCLFKMFLIILFFFISPLYVKWRLPYII